MAKHKLPFHKLWSTRFCEPGNMHVGQIHTLHAELVSACGDHTWTRMVINNWAGNPLNSYDQVYQMVSWLAEAADDQVFVAKRGVSDLGAGVQVWCVKPEVQLLVHMMCTPVINVRLFPPALMKDHTLTMMNWMLTP